MTDITSFNIQGRYVRFTLTLPDDELDFTVKYPERYQFGQQHEEILKDIPLMLWGNAIGFTNASQCEICFDVSESRLRFFTWIGQTNAALDAHYSGEPFEWGTPSVETGSDTSKLISSDLPDKEYQGTMICQSTGKESLSSLHIMQELGRTPIHSVFVGYPSRAATHKQDSREKFREYFDHDAHRVWSNFNHLQSTLQEYADNYDPCVQFWEMFYAAAALPIAVEHGLKYILIGNELNAGKRIFHDGVQTFEELNQSWKFEHRYTDYIVQNHGLPIVHTSVVQPMTDFGCRKVMYREFPDFLHALESCLRPTASHGKWCEKCYKCQATWLESLALGVDPETFGMSHDILFKSPHLGGDDEDWGYSFPKPNRDEVIWQEYDVMDKLPNYGSDRLEGLQTWRNRQEERVDAEAMGKYKNYYDQWSSPVSKAIPQEVRYNPKLEETTYAPEGYAP